MTDNYINDIRVVQNLSWVEQDDGTKKIQPTSYAIQIQRNGSEEWMDIQVIYNKPDAIPEENK